MPNSNAMHSKPTTLPITNLSGLYRLAYLHDESFEDQDDALPQKVPWPKRSNSDFQRLLQDIATQRPQEETFHVLFRAHEVDFKAFCHALLVDVLAPTMHSIAQAHLLEIHAQRQYWRWHKLCGPDDYRTMGWWHQTQRRQKQRMHYFDC